MTEERCPRCHEPLPADACYEALPLVPGHLPAYRLRHKRASGQTCVVYAGAPRDDSAPGHGHEIARHLVVLAGDPVPIGIQPVGITRIGA